MPNPRYLGLRKQGDLYIPEPTVELLKKMTTGKEVYMANLNWFCDKYGLPMDEFLDIQKAYLIGSHASVDDWQEETSDLDLMLVNPSVMPANFHAYKREVLNSLLCRGIEKKRWIDIYCVREEYQVNEPRVEITNAWKNLVLKQ